MTYAEQKGKDTFDWNNFLSKNCHSVEEWEEAQALASNWVTCACGNQCSIIPRRGNGCPIDYELEVWGREFYCGICDEDIPRARKALINIERQSEFLIQRHESQNPKA